MQLFGARNKKQANFQFLSVTWFSDAPERLSTRITMVYRCGFPTPIGPWPLLYLQRNQRLHFRWLQLTIDEEPTTIALRDTH
jgi:hypothetical protein